MVFDDIHCALPNNANDWIHCGGREVLKLQSAFKLSRVVYTSARLADMGRMLGLCSRLGIWQKESWMTTKEMFLVWLEKR